MSKPTTNSPTPGKKGKEKEKLSTIQEENPELQPRAAIHRMALAVRKEGGPDERAKLAEQVVGRDDQRAELLKNIEEKDETIQNLWQKISALEKAIESAKENHHMEVINIKCNLRYEKQKLKDETEKQKALITEKEAEILSLHKQISGLEKGSFTLVNVFADHIHDLSRINRDPEVSNGLPEPDSAEDLSQLRMMKNRLAEAEKDRAGRISAEETAKLERSRADNAQLELRDAKKLVENLQKEITSLRRLLEEIHRQYKDSNERNEENSVEVPAPTVEKIEEGEKRKNDNNNKKEGKEQE